MRLRQLGLGLALALVLTAIASALAFSQRYGPPAPPAQPPSPSSGSFAAQAKTAAAHASFAAEGTSVSYAREHLGHVIVCIEGKKGKNVNAAWENPCSGQGNGVLNDLRGSAASWSLVAQAADGLAVAGLKHTDLAKMKAAARGVSTLMKLVAEAK